MTRLIGLLAILFGLMATGAFGQHAAAKPVTVDIVNAQGKAVGTATLSPAANGVTIKLDIKSLPPGPHLMHIHEFPKCEPPDFKSAGSHFNAGGEHHGEHEHAGLPAGDIPNFVLQVSADGTAHTSVVAPGVSFGTEKNSVFSNGGTALIIHAVAVEVSASAPPRIACAVIAKP